MRKLVLSILLTMQAVLVFAQQTGTITGNVVDNKNQKSLHNVVVSLLGSNLTQNTNTEGKFTITNVPAGNHVVQIRSTGFSTLNLPVEVAPGQVVDLSTITMSEDITSEIQLSLITLTENDLGDDNSGSETTSGLLQASRDVFEQTAAYNWGQARYRIRGLDNEYGNVMINGISMNKLYDGRPQFSNWGGLNDATRNQEYTSGSKASDYTFGSALGSQHINTRASYHRPGNRVSVLGTNTNYNWRVMGTHASGLDKDGWAYTVSASYRMANEGHFEGTDYDAKSAFFAIEKRINDKHSLNATAIYANNTRGKNSPNTEEVNDIAGIKYNSYWGWQNGKKRNSRDKEVEEPMFILSHYWKITDNTKLNTNVAYQFGKIGNSRLDYYKADNPDPTYYRNLPSYWTTQHLDGVWVGGSEENIAKAADARETFLANRQIDWDAMYAANQREGGNGRSVYVLYEDRTDDRQFTANTILNTKLADNIIFNGAVNYRKLRSENFQNLLDLLGGEYFVDLDPYFLGDAQHPNLLNPFAEVREGDRYGYNYILRADVIDAFTQFKFNYRKFDFYLSQSYSNSAYQREGLYQNGIYANNSLGKSKTQRFDNYGFKGGLVYKLTGKHMFEFNALYMTKAPALKNVFPNVRLNNTITTDIQSETISSVDAGYIIRTPKFKGRLSGFYSKIKDATEVSFFFAEGLGIITPDMGTDASTSTSNNQFVAEIVRGLDKQNIGVEFGAEYQLTTTLKATVAASVGQYIYTSNPNVALNIDNFQSTIDLGESKLKNYRQAGMPQTAASLGLEYRSPKYWWIGANANYLDNNYLDVSALMRTNNFVLDPNSPNGLAVDGANEQSVRSILKQEKFESIMLVNLVGGKSWRVGRNTIGFFANINNLFDIKYKTGGFEQGRNASFTEVSQDLQGPNRSFGPKYFYGYGRTYMVNLYMNF